MSARAVPDSEAKDPSIPPALTLRPIGYVRTTQQVKFQARHQPDETEPAAAGGEIGNVLELLPESGLELALRDLAGFDRVWLIWWFHRNDTWNPLVRPPRGPSVKRGVFATRSPHRPNPLGMTPVRLLGVEGRRLFLGPCDLVDGTPVFDIKPYVPAYDSFPEAAAGWIDDVDAADALPPRFTVRLGALALEQAEWLRAGWGIDFTPRLHELLARDPSPHRTRRIRRQPGERFEIGCGAWRACFTVSGEQVAVDLLGPAYPRRFLLRPGYEEVPDRSAQLAFLEVWPDSELPLKD
jgi:tRNA-Thr(GGU) m(6)t(6)A37 methyltransferase TsaA